MKRSEVIARCLDNSSMVGDLEHGRSEVFRLFSQSFPKESFARWDIEIDDNVGHSIIQAVGRAMQINVISFINDLRRY